MSSPEPGTTARVEPPLDAATAAAIQTTIAYLDARVKQANAALEAADSGDVAPMEDIQKLFALSLRLYVANYHAGWDIPIFHDGHGVCATDVMITSTEMLKAVNVQLFELGMFQTWSKH